MVETHSARFFAKQLVCFKVMCFDTHDDQSADFDTHDDQSADFDTHDDQSTDFDSGLQHFLPLYTGECEDQSIW